MPEIPYVRDMVGSLNMINTKCQSCLNVMHAAIACLALLLEVVRKILLLSHEITYVEVKSTYSVKQMTFYK